MKWLNRLKNRLRGTDRIADSVQAGTPVVVVKGKPYVLEGKDLRPLKRS